MSILVRNVQRLVRVDLRRLHAQLLCLRQLLFAPNEQSHAMRSHLVSRARMAHLNRLYANESGATDVLSFPTRNLIPAELPEEMYVDMYTGEKGHPPPDALNQHLGDVYIGADICRHMASRRNVPLHDYFAVVATHAVAHLAGLDHATMDEWEAMRKKEMMALQELRQKGLVEKPLVLPESYLSQWGSKTVAVPRRKDS